MRFRETCGENRLFNPNPRDLTLQASRAARMVALLFAVATVTCGLQSNTQTEESRRVRLTEDSDWWSGLRTIEEVDVGPTQEREVSGSNFKIVGIALEENFFELAAKKLGRTTVVERGDAAGGREQACYVSLGAGKKIYLIFERGEVNYSFYLFSGGKPWNGRELCAASEQVGLQTSTVSGLRLGLTQKQVIAILGRPSLQRKDRLVYSLHATKKLTEEELKLVRKNHPEISDEELHRNFESYDWSVGLDFKFEDSKLTFLAVSLAETN